MTLGGFGPDNLLEIVARDPALADAARDRPAHRHQRAVPDGVVVLASDGESAGRPLRRSLALLVDSFALALVMIAFLLPLGRVRLVSGETPFETIRRVTFFVDRPRADRLPRRPARARAWRGRRSATSSSSCGATRRRRTCATRSPARCATRR